MFPPDGNLCNDVFLLAHLMCLFILLGSTIKDHGSQSRRVWVDSSWYLLIQNVKPNSNPTITENASLEPRKETRKLEDKTKLKDTVAVTKTRLGLDYNLL